MELFWEKTDKYFTYTNLYRVNRKFNILIVLTFMKLRKIDRLDAWMRRNNLTDAALTREVGLSNGLLYKSRRPGQDLTKKTITAIVKRYPELDEEWLYTGNGQMNDPLVMIAQFVNEISSNKIIDDKSIEYLLKDIVKKNSFMEMALEEIAKVNMLMQKTQEQIDFLLDISIQRSKEIEAFKNVLLEYNRIWSENCKQSLPK